jgi:uncharacterized protein YjfI (DUF2170 family)
MSQVQTLDSLHEMLEGVETPNGLLLKTEYVDIQDETYLRITSHDHEEFPFIARIDSIDNMESSARIVIQTVLFDSSDLNKTQRNEINAEFLTLNTILPLSATSLVNGKYVIYGELSASSIEENIILEIDTLLSNLLDVLENVIERVNLLGDYNPEADLPEM